MKQGNLSSFLNKTNRCVVSGARCCDWTFFGGVGERLHQHVLTQTLGCEFLQAQEEVCLGKANPSSVLWSPSLPRLGRCPPSLSLLHLLHPVCLTFLGSQPLWDSDGGCGSSSGDMQMAHSVLCSFQGHLGSPRPIHGFSRA